LKLLFFQTKNVILFLESRQFDIKIVDHDILLSFFLRHGGDSNSLLLGCLLKWMTTLWQHWLRFNNDSVVGNNLLRSSSALAGILRQAKNSIGQSLRAIMGMVLLSVRA